MLVFILSHEKTKTFQQIKLSIEGLNLQLKINMLPFNKLREYRDTSHNNFVFLVNVHQPFHINDFKNCYENINRLRDEECGIVVGDKGNNFNIICIRNKKLVEYCNRSNNIAFQRYVLMDIYLYLYQNCKLKFRTLNRVRSNQRYLSLDRQLIMEEKHISPIIQYRHINIKKKMTEQISIVMCTYNNADYLDWSIYSVLSQTVGNWELVIINDGSSDQTKEILDRYNGYPSIRIIHSMQNRGKASCLNQALQLITGGWIIELDADDWLAENCLEIIDPILGNANKGTDALFYGNYVEWKERTRDQKLFYSKEINGPDVFHSEEYLNKPFALAPRIYNVELLKQVGGWNVNDPSQGKMFEDVYMICSLQKKFKVIKINRLLYHRRLRVKSVTNQSAIPFTKWRNWLRKHLNL
ncbi:hypothetical protein BC6307_04765 [Sutcliffiella cohnii]|uniref:Glycosyltransferase 2-like domain-containing protein n=2 Tax=Bacillaceae TaxID=186817 RepID=A0A223KMA6_9BACI|nr:hypothetical protein BC6307_04765 [Sutcliffiella cohnii]